MNNTTESSSIFAKDATLNKIYLTKKNVLVRVTAIDKKVSLYVFGADTVLDVNGDYLLSTPTTEDLKKLPDIVAGATANKEEAIMNETKEETLTMDKKEVVETKEVVSHEDKRPITVSRKRGDREPKTRIMDRMIKEGASDVDILKYVATIYPEDEELRSKRTLGVRKSLARHQK